MGLYFYNQLKKDITPIKKIKYKDWLIIFYKIKNKGNNKFRYEYIVIPSDKAFNLLKVQKKLPTYKVNPRIITPCSIKEKVVLKFMNRINKLNSHYINLSPTSFIRLKQAIENARMDINFYKTPYFKLRLELIQ